MSAVWGTATSGIAVAVCVANLVLQLRLQRSDPEWAPTPLVFLLLGLALVSTKTLAPSQRFIACVGGVFGALILQQVFVSVSHGHGFHFSLYLIVFILLGQATPFIASASNLRSPISQRLRPHLKDTQAFAITAVVMAGVACGVALEWLPPVLGASFSFFIATLFTVRERVLGIVCIASAAAVGIVRAVDRLPDMAVLPAVVGFSLAAASLVIGLITIPSHRGALS